MQLLPHRSGTQEEVTKLDTQLQSLSDQQRDTLDIIEKEKEKKKKDKKEDPMQIAMGKIHFVNSLQKLYDNLRLYWR